MLQIDYEATMKNAKEHLDIVTKLIKMGCYQIEKKPLHEIEEFTRLDKLCTVSYPTKFDKVVLYDFEVISRMSLENKRILYCVHMLCMKRRWLRSDEPPYDYSFGDPFKRYKQALIEFGLTNSVFMEFIGMEERGEENESKSY